MLEKSREIKYTSIRYCCFWEESVMICNRCGTENLDTDNTCKTCGGLLCDEIIMEVIDGKSAYEGKTIGLVSMIFGITSLVLGTILSFVMPIFGGAFPGGMAIVGVILGIIGRRKSKAAKAVNAMAIVGLGTSVATIVAVILTNVLIVMFFVFVIWLSTLSTPMYVA